jgi:MFS family permease
MTRVAFGFAAFNVAEWATWVAMLVYAYERGGATASSVVAVVQLAPAALFAPFGAALADRYQRERVLLAAYIAQAVAMAATATALFANAPIAIVYVLAAVAATSITLTRPAQNGLIPSLVSSSDALPRANATLGTIENASIVAGPAVAGLMLATSGAGLVFAVMAAWLALSAVAIAGIHVRPNAVAPDALDSRTAFGILASEPRASLLIGLLALQQLQVGALDVLFVALALGVLGIGETGVGFLTAAVGLGGMLGALIAGTLPQGLARWMAIGAVVWGVGLMLVAPLTQVASVFALVIAAGAGRGLMDVAGRTLLQRVAPPTALSRAFGVLEGLTMAALAIGAGIAAFLVDRFGASGAVAAIGAVLPIVLVLVVRPLTRIERAATVTSAEGAPAPRRG